MLALQRGSRPGSLLRSLGWTAPWSLLARGRAFEEAALETGPRPRASLWAWLAEQGVSAGTGDRSIDGRSLVFGSSSKGNTPHSQVDSQIPEDQILSDCHKNPMFYHGGWGGSLLTWSFLVFLAYLDHSRMEDTTPHPSAMWEKLCKSMIADSFL